MLFSVYPQGMPPQRSGPNPLLIALGACGGCALLAVIGVVTLGFFAVQAGKGIVKAVSAQKDQGRQFMEDIKAHRYAEAESMFSPSGQKLVPQEALKALVEKTEKKFGPIQNWDAAELNTSSHYRTRRKKGPVKVTVGQTDTGTASAAKELRMAYTYRVHLEKGDAIAAFTYISTDPFHPSEQISDFTLTPAESDSEESPTRQNTN